MRLLFAGDRRNEGAVRRNGIPANASATWAAMLVAVVITIGGAAAGCGSVSGGGAKDAGSGGATGAGGADAAVDHTETAVGGAPGAGGAAGASDASTTSDATSDTPTDAPRDGATCTLPASCAALHACDPTLVSGNYMIAPDGTVDAAPILVHCDMDIGGGGWTVIYLADGINLNSTTIDYTVTSQRLRDNAQEALISFRNLNQNMVASDWASFGLPATWRAKNPLTVSPFEEITVSASVNGALPALALLRYGTANFGSVCGDAWNTTTTPYGRLCLQGTDAAFYSGFATAAATTDFCALSSQTYSVRACSDMLRFSIAVR